MKGINGSHPPQSVRDCRRPLTPGLRRTTDWQHLWVERLSLLQRRHRCKRPTQGQHVSASHALWHNAPHHALRCMVSMTLRPKTLSSRNVLHIRPVISLTSHVSAAKREQSDVRGLFLTMDQKTPLKIGRGSGIAVKQHTGNGEQDER